MSPAEEKADIVEALRWFARYRLRGLTAEQFAGGHHLSIAEALRYLADRLEKLPVSNPTETIAELEGLGVKGEAQCS